MLISENNEETDSENPTSDNKRLTSRTKMIMLKNFTDEIVKTNLLPVIQIPAIQIPPMPQLPPLRSSQPPDLIEGFLIQTGHHLRSLPIEVAEDLMDDFLVQLKKAKKEMRHSKQQ